MALSPAYMIVSFSTSPLFVPFRVNPFRMNPFPFCGKGEIGGEVTS